MHERVAFSLALCLITGSALAQNAAPTRKPGGSVGTSRIAAWELTDDERIARRAARDENAGGHIRPAGSQSGFKDSVDGRHNPELFLPYELFDALLRGISGDDKHK